MQIGADTHGRLVKRLSVKSFDPYNIVQFLDCPLL